MLLAKSGPYTVWSQHLVGDEACLVFKRLAAAHKVAQIEMRQLSYLAFFNETQDVPGAQTSVTITGIVDQVNGRQTNTGQVINKPKTDQFSVKLIAPLFGRNRVIEE